MAEVKFIPNPDKPPVSSSSQQPKKHDKIATGKVTVKKKSELQKIAEVFIADDLNKVKHSIIYDYVVPAVKNLIVGALTEAVRMTFQGNAYRPNYNGFAPTPPNTVNVGSYSRYWTNPNNQPQYAPYSGMNNPQEIIFTTRRDAEAVLSEMLQSIATYGRVSVAEYYDMVGITTDYTDYAYGWTDLQPATIAVTAGGYVIRLPRAVVLKR